MSRGHPLNVLTQTFAICVAAGLAFLIGVLAVSPESAAALLDPHRDGVDMKDALAFAWLFGHAAILIHHFLPGIARV